MKKLLLLMYLVVSSVAMSQKAAESQKVAMLPTVAKNELVTSMQKSIILSSLTIAITQAEGYEAFTRNELNAIVGEQKLQQDGMVSESERIKLGELSGATLICISSVTADDANLFVEASLVDVKTGKIVSSSNQLIESKSSSIIKSNCVILAENLLGKGKTVEKTQEAPKSAPVKESKTSKTEGIELVYVKGGTYKMGCSTGTDNCSKEQLPSHTVTVNSFKIGKTEVTVAQFMKFVNETGYKVKTKQIAKWCKNVRLEECNFPVVGVLHEDAVAFCTWAGGRLPSEAEWEYAARGGEKSKGYRYSGSNVLGEVGWYEKNSKDNAKEVGKKQPNELGLYDMSGNVWEWCLDTYTSGFYVWSESDNPICVLPLEEHVIRGGSWYDEEPEECRVTQRNASDEPDTNYGFRLVVPVN